MNPPNQARLSVMNFIIKNPSAPGGAVEVAVLRLGIPVEDAQKAYDACWAIWEPRLQGSPDDLTIREFAGECAEAFVNAYYDAFDNEVFISSAEAHGAKVFPLAEGATFIAHGSKEFILPPKCRGRIFRVNGYPDSCVHIVDEKFLRIDAFLTELGAVEVTTWVAPS